MATTQVNVRPSAPAPAPAPTPGAPDVFRAFRGELERVFNRFFTGFGFPASSGARFDAAVLPPVPAAEVTETETEWRIAVELPGLSETDVEVGISGEQLTLRGEKRQETEKTEANTYLSERSYGAFERGFLLPDGVDRDRIAASFTKGVLTVRLPKTAAAQQAARKIEVKPG